MSEHKSNDAQRYEAIRADYFEWCKKKGSPVPSDSDADTFVRGYMRHEAEQAANAQVTPPSLPPGDQKYPDEQLGFFDHGKTSCQTRAASARDSIKHKDAWKTKCLEALQSRGRYGAIADEMAATFGVDNCCLTSALLELRGEGLVFVTSRKRPTRRGKNAAVMVAMSFIVSDKEGKR